MKVGQANGEFLGHLAEVLSGRKTMDWLRSKWHSEVNRAMVDANLKHWGLSGKST